MKLLLNYSNSNFVKVISDLRYGIINHCLCVPINFQKYILCISEYILNRKYFIIYVPVILLVKSGGGNFWAASRKSWPVDHDIRGEVRSSRRILTFVFITVLSKIMIINSLSSVVRKSLSIAFQMTIMTRYKHKHKYNNSLIWPYFAPIPFRSSVMADWFKAAAAYSPPVYVFISFHFVLFRVVKSKPICCTHFLYA